MRSLSTIHPYAKNPRKNDGAVDAVAESIRQFGFRQPIVVDAQGVIVCGHTRWKAAQKLGLTEVPVHVAADLSPERVKALRIADNKTGELAEWDADLLADELGSISDIDFAALGFDQQELDRALQRFDIAGARMPDLPSGEKSPFQQMTFTLHDSQAEVVRDAVARALDSQDFDGAVNENSNGNALAYICGAFLGRG